MQSTCNILPTPFFTFTLVSSELESITNTVSGCGCDRQCYDLMFINCQVLPKMRQNVSQTLLLSLSLKLSLELS